MGVGVFGHPRIMPKVRWRRPDRSRRNRSQSGGGREHRRERAQRVAAVADRVLLLGLISALVRALAVRHEDRVVAEPVGAARRSRRGARAPPSTTPRGRPAATSAAAQTKCAPRRSSGTSASWASSRSRLAASPRAARTSAPKTPGIPPSTSTHRPESSATAGSPVAAATARALSRAFPANVAPVSATSGTSGNASMPTTSTGRPSVVEDPAQLVDLVRRCGWPARRGWSRARRAPPPADGSARRTRRPRGRAARRARRGRTARPRRCPAPRRTGRRRS